MYRALCRCHAVCLAVLGESTPGTACTTSARRAVVWCDRQRSTLLRLHTSKQHTQEHHMSMCWHPGTSGHASISASDLLRSRRLRDLLLLPRGLLWPRGVTSRRPVHVRWRKGPQAPCCATWQAALALECVLRCGGGVKAGGCRGACVCRARAADTSMTTVNKAA